MSEGTTDVFYNIPQVYLYYIDGHLSSLFCWQPIHTGDVSPFSTLLAFRKRYQGMQDSQDLTHRTQKWHLWWFIQGINAMSSGVWASVCRKRKANRCSMVWNKKEKKIDCERHTIRREVDHFLQTNFRQQDSVHCRLTTWKKKSNEKKVNLHQFQNNPLLPNFEVSHPHWNIYYVHGRFEHHQLNNCVYESQKFLQKIFPIRHSSRQTHL